MNDEQLRAVAAIEHSLIGRVIHDATVLDNLPPIERDDFVDPKSEAMWSAILNLLGESRQIDHLSVDAELARMGRLEMCGGSGVAYTWSLDGMAMHETSAVLHATDIRQRGLAKRVVTRLSDVLGRVRKDGLTGDEALSEVQAAINRLSTHVTDSTVTIGQAVELRMQELEQLEKRREAGETVMTGLPTGIERLDALIGGWQIGIVQLLCGRPAMGKSSALMASIDACSAAGIGAHLFTLEDSLAAHGDRALSRESMVPSSDIRALKLNREQFDNLKAARKKLHKRKGWIVDERAGITADEIVRCARKHAKENGTKLVVVDYVNLVRHPKDAHQALTEIITTFATSAKNDGFAYLVAAQLNRGLESRDDKRPRMSDLRESGSLEERAKLIVSVYRSSYYYASPQQGIDYDPAAPAEASIPKTRMEAERLFARTVQLGVIKNNGGPTGTIHATWDAPTCRVW